MAYAHEIETKRRQTAALDLTKGLVRDAEHWRERNTQSNNDWIAIKQNSQRIITGISGYTREDEASQQLVTNREEIRRLVPTAHSIQVSIRPDNSGISNWIDTMLSQSIENTLQQAGLRITDASISADQWRTNSIRRDGRFQLRAEFISDELVHPPATTKANIPVMVFVSDSGGVDRIEFVALGMPEVESTLPDLGDINERVANRIMSGYEKLSASMPAPMFSLSSGRPNKLMTAIVSRYLDLFISTTNVKSNSVPVTDTNIPTRDSVLIKVSLSEIQSLVAPLVKSNGVTLSSLSRVTSQSLLAIGTRRESFSEKFSGVKVSIRISARVKQRVALTPIGYLISLVSEGPASIDRVRVDRLRAKVAGIKVSVPSAALRLANSAAKALGVNLKARINRAFRYYIDCNRTRFSKVTVQPAFIALEVTKSIGPGPTNSTACEIER